MVLAKQVALLLNIVFVLEAIDFIWAEVRFLAHALEMKDASLLVHGILGHRISFDLIVFAAGNNLRGGGFFVKVFSDCGQERVSLYNVWL